MFEKILGKNISGVRVVPISVKIILIFTVILLVSNFSTNYVSLVMNRGELNKYINRLLIRDLKDLHVFMTNQHDIYLFSDDKEKSVDAIKESAQWNLKNENSLALGWNQDDGYMFIVPENHGLSNTDLQRLKDVFIEYNIQDITEGPVQVSLQKGEYFGAFKYNELWDAYIFRGEDTNELYAASRRNFIYISMIIILISVVCMTIGIYMLRFILRYVTHISNSIMAMQENQDLTLIDMDGAVNDDITYLGMAFNSLSSTINNLMNIFKKFVARDIAAQAYKEREIRLEGKKRYLTVLFTDIKRFTNMTETLGNDIIKLLNLHYDQAIRRIHAENGDIGSIIGDALLAIFGAMHEEGENKSLQAVRAGYEILNVASDLRNAMRKQAEKIVKTKEQLSTEEQKVLDAVLLEVGVGIDGGEVFYGNIGSTERMVNTVIGDNVNSSSRLEGLTRFYKVPVITSRYVKDEVEKDSKEYYFMELDMVMVKGKTEGKDIYWPVEIKEVDAEMQRQIDMYKKALQLYYDGDWREAIKYFRGCTLAPAAVFRERISRKNPPEDWNGVWTMTTK
ncbi:MAG: adenylate/guanylate cyclase domain-containing protein [Spirochaetales bacterium]|nr:adenylate/guanylate cyclase domain-containing protein [Spirochaetales bacterium]